MNIKLPLILSFLAGLGTILGSLLSVTNIYKKKANMCFILSFSGSIMLFISVLDLLPKSIYTIIYSYSVFKALLLIIIPFLLGVIILKLINNHINENNNLKRVGILSFISLIIHNFPEGIATFISAAINLKLGLKLSVAIAMHNIPEGICIAVPIKESTGSLKKGLFYSFLSALSEPIGALCTFIFLKNYINEITLSIILIFVAGLMITLSIETIYKESLNYKEYKAFILGILSSFLYILISVNI